MRELETPLQQFGEFILKAQQGRLVIDEAFEVARRRLQDYARRHRLEVKRHGEPPVGRVHQLLRGLGTLARGRN